MTRAEEALGQGVSETPRPGEPKAKGKEGCLGVAGSLWAWGKRQCFGPKLLG